MTERDGFHSAPLRLCCAFLLFSSLIIAGSSRQAHAVLNATAPGPPLDELTEEALINKLQDEARWGVGFQPAAWGSVFFGFDEQPRLQRGDFKPMELQISPVMRELVRRGLKSLPKLLDHLEDKRPTRLVVESRGFWVLQVQSENPYPFKRSAKATSEPTSPVLDRSVGKSRDVLEKGREGHSQYTVKVGDLCFVAIGQIVNRRFNVLEFRPSNTLVIQSPLASPNLAMACRREWAALTPEKHRESLLEDCFSPFNLTVPMPAVERLYFYHQKDGEKIIISYIESVFCDDKIVSEFVLNNLICITGRELHEFGIANSMVSILHRLGYDMIWLSRQSGRITKKAEQKLYQINDGVKEMARYCLLSRLITIPPANECLASLNHFRMKFGEEMTSRIPVDLLYNHIEKVDELPDTLIRKYKAEAILPRVFPGFNRQDYYFASSAKKKDLVHFLDELPTFSNRKIDEAIFQVFQSVTAPGAGKGDDHRLALTCVDRLAGKEFDRALRNYLEKRIEAETKELDQGAMGNWLETHKKQLQKLKK